eukprot:6188333-Pleurochrysis_carterae.AAC.1
MRTRPTQSAPSGRKLKSLKISKRPNPVGFRIRLPLCGGQGHGAVLFGTLLPCYEGLTSPQSYAPFTKCIFRQYTDIGQIDYFVGIALNVTSLAKVNIEEYYLAAD